MKDFWALPVTQLLNQLDASENGLTDEEARKRKKSGRINAPSQLKRDLHLFFKQFKSPLVLILITAVVLSSALSEFTNTAIILSIVILTGVLGFVQERKADRAVTKLLELVKVTATVMRDGSEHEVPFEALVPGDIIIFNAGDIIPADCRLIRSVDLHTNEASLTGESFPQEKDAMDLPIETPIGKRKNCLFQGTSVVNGTATALITNIGADTFLGSIASGLKRLPGETDFEKGFRKFGYLLMRVTLVIALVIVTLNVYLGRPLIDSFLFGLSLALGMTPELLPAIVTITLSKGARQLAEKKVITKKLEAIQNLGSINVFCVDKTGTLTEGKPVVQSAIDIEGNSSDKVRLYAYLNAVYETGFANPLDEALRSLEVKIDGYTKFDEVPYDFIRKRLSIVVSFGGRHIMITKGAVKKVLEICDKIELKNTVQAPLDLHEQINKLQDTYGEQGARTIAVAWKDVTGDPLINKDDEQGMTFLGLVVLSDTPKPGIQDSLRRLNSAGIKIKLITGDNEKVARHLSSLVGLSSPWILTGNMLNTITDEALVPKVMEVSVFAETEPHQKERIVRALRKAGNVVGYIGDGINDVAAMKSADVSISVDSAVDVAKEAADIVLMERNLDILAEGVYEGRKTFTNTMKYIFITCSANMGNMFSMAAASIFLPFLPLLPKQILLTNFLTDLPAMTLSGDNVEKESIVQSAKWNNSSIQRFMIVFGGISSLFDFLTFGILMLVFHATTIQFQTGWFIESVVSEMVTLLIIRTRRPVFKSSPGKDLLITTVILMGTVFLLPYSMLAGGLGLVVLPNAMILAMIGVVILYGFVMEVTKRYFF